jgi:uncharacterized small protein (DUF1192 family)
MAVGVIDIILKASPEAMINNMNKAQNVITQFQDSVEKSNQKYGNVLQQANDATILFKSITSEAFSVAANSISATSATTEVESAKMLSNIDGIASGLGAGIESFGLFQGAATTALSAIISIAPVATASIAGLAGPIGIAIAAIGAIATGVAAWSSTQEKNNELIKKNTDAVAQETTEVTELFRQLKNTNATSEANLDIRKRIDNQYGTTLANIRDEKKLANELNRAYKDIIESIKAKYALQANDKEIQNLVKKIAGNESYISGLKGSLEYYKQFDASGTSGASVPGDTKNAIAEAEKNNASLKKEFDDLIKKSLELGKALEIGSSNSASASKEKVTKKLKEAKDEITAYRVTILDPVQKIFSDAQDEITKRSNELSFLPKDLNTDIDAAENEIKSLTDALSQLGVIGVEPNNQYLLKLQEQLAGAKKELEALRQEAEDTKNAGSLNLVTGQDRPGLTSSQNDKPRSGKTPGQKAGLEFENPEQLGNAIAGIAGGINVASTDQVREAVAALNAEIAKNQAILSDNKATRAAKETASAQIAAAKAQIAAEREKGNVAIQVSKQIYQAIRDRVKVYLAEAIGGYLSKTLSLGPAGLIVGAAGAGAIIGLFDKLVPKLDVGTDFVYKEGLAHIHKGEAIVDAAEVKSGGFSGLGGGKDANVKVSVTGEISGNSIILATKNAQYLSERLNG